MKRQHPFLSSIGFILTALLLAGLGLVLRGGGGLAFSPGPLSAVNRTGEAQGGFDSHAGFETECGRCHAPFEAAQETLCTACHTRVSEQLTSGRGTHARVEAVQRCSGCHPEHQGRDFDLTSPALERFDHFRTGFSLGRHLVSYPAPAALTGRPIDCADCHTQQGLFALQPDGCVTCHGQHDPAFMLRHLEEYGELGEGGDQAAPACQVCHDGVDHLARFDHSRTAFPLEGEHAGVSCAGCHGQGQPGFILDLASTGAARPFNGTPTDCSACHAEPKLHRGFFSPQCDACHSPAGWVPALLEGAPFDHEAAGFSLQRHNVNFDGASLNCQACHPAGDTAASLEACTACHTQGEETPGFMADHINFYGPACLDCHDGADRMQDFDHSRVFPLDGRHAGIECQDCHVDRVFKGTPAKCEGCHTEPEIHAGLFGMNCEYCHTAAAWSPAALRAHSFPLDHGDQGESSCQTCHAGRYSEYTCYGCHEHEPGEVAEEHAEEGITAEELPRCTECHLNGE